MKRDAAQPKLVAHDQGVGPHHTTQAGPDTWISGPSFRYAANQSPSAEARSQQVNSSRCAIT